MDEAEAARNGAGNSPAETEPPLRGRDLFAVLLLTGILLFLVKGLIRDPARTVEFVLAMLALQSAIPVAVIYLVLIRGRGFGWAALGLRPAPRHWLLRAVLVALASLPLVAAVNLATQMLAGGPIRNPQLDIVAPGGFSWRGLIGMVVMAGMVAPMVEEVLFRGLLYGWLRARLGVAAAVVLSAFLFALVHGIPMLMPAIAVQGVLLALLYERSGSLWPAIVMHGTFNAIMTLALYAALAAGLSPT